MHTFTLDTSLARPSWIARAVRLFSASQERERAINELEKLTDVRLRDIGVERQDIPHRIDTEMAKIDVRQLGRLGLC